MQSAIAGNDEEHVLGHFQLRKTDRLYLERACELAARAIGDTSPNPPVGAVIVRDGEIVGEGYHHRSGASHAEVEALRCAGDRANGATLYVSLEPCNHFGKTPPCSRAVADAGVARVVIGTLDPNPKTARGGLAALGEAGIDVEVADTVQAQRLIEPFAHAIRNTHRPYVSLKMAASADGFIAERSGKQFWLTGEPARDAVRDLRISHDAVMVGAGTVRVDDPQLTVRPPHARARPYVRVVICETDALPTDRHIFEPAQGYDKTIVVAPGGMRDRFARLHDLAEVLYVGDEARALDLTAALYALRRRGLQSILCEGGPTLAGRLMAHGLVDRYFLLMAPLFLSSPAAVPALKLPGEPKPPSIGIDCVERLGPDLLLSGMVKSV